MPEDPSDDPLVLDRALQEVRRVIVGQDLLLERVLTALLASGHILIEGVPGLAKTRTIRAFSEVLGGDWKRVQFTPDLVPSDVIGTRVWQPATGSFQTELGPVATNFLLADEINRAPAKVQSALLEAMEERQVTIGRETFPLPRPFLVLATQNPIESEGTFPLPEAQTDRFVMRVVVDHPGPEAELEILRRHLEGDPFLNAVADPDVLLALIGTRRKVHVPREVAERIVSLVERTRNPERIDAELAGSVAVGAGVRGSIALLVCAQSRALLHGRHEVTLGDLTDLAGDVLAHRVVLAFEATAAGMTQRDLVERAVASFGGWE